MKLLPNHESVPVRAVEVFANERGEARSGRVSGASAAAFQRNPRHGGTACCLAPSATRGVIVCDVVLSEPANAIPIAPGLAPVAS